MPYKVIKCDKPCPNCGSIKTWLIEEKQCIVQKCICGLHKYLLHISEEGGVTVMRRTVRNDEVLLPEAGTKTFKCLVAIADHYPTIMDTATIAGRAGLQNKETSALLSVLMTRGLVDRVEGRKKWKGGSTWKLSYSAERIMRIQEREYRRSL